MFVPDKNTLRVFVVSAIVLSILNAGLQSGSAYPYYDVSLESMFEEAVFVYNSNFDRFRESSILHGLISRFGNERVLLRVYPTGEIVSVVLREGRVVEYRVGEEMEGITLEVEVEKAALFRIFYSEDPVGAYSSASAKGEVRVSPRTVKLQILSVVANVARGILRFFGR